MRAFPKIVFLALSMAWVSAKVNAQYVERQGYFIEDNSIAISEHSKIFELASVLEQVPQLPSYSDVFRFPEAFGQLSRDHQDEWQAAAKVHVSQRQALKDRDEILELEKRRELEIDRWVSEVLSETERTRVEKVRLQFGFAKYGVFIFESAEARELAPWLGDVSEKLSKLSARRMEYIQARRRHVAKMQSDAVDEMLSPDAQRRLHQILLNSEKPIQKEDQ